MASDELVTKFRMICEDEPVEHLRRLLKKETIDVNMKFDDGWTPLMITNGLGKPLCTYELLDYGADPNTSVNGTTALCDAVFYEHYQCVDHLLGFGANLDIPDENGDTPLHLACQLKNDVFVRLLLNNGADPNIRNKMGITPMHKLLLHRFDEEESMKDVTLSLECCLRHLLNKGGDPMKKDPDGNTFMQIVTQHLQYEYSYPALVEALKECQKLINEHMASTRKKRARVEVVEDEEELEEGEVVLKVEPTAKRGRSE